MTLVSDWIAAQAAIFEPIIGALALASLVLWRLDVRARRRQARLDALEAIITEARRLQGIPPERRSTQYLKSQINAAYGRGASE